MIARVKSRSTAAKAAVYVVWISLCATLFGALRHAEDPSRRPDRILNNDAAARAEKILDAQPCCRGYDVVHVAYANRGEGGAEARWIVLLDREPHSALHEARVVELRASDGALVEIRRPK